MRGYWKSVLLVLAVASLVVAAGCSSSDPASPTNDAPTITSVTVTPASVGAGGSATVTVTANDSDGDGLSYAYSPNGGAISGSGPSVTWTAPGTAGAYSVAVTVTDGEGGSVSSSGSLTVTAQVTTIHGTVSLPGGVPGSLGNGVVSIYASYDDWNNYQPSMSATVVGVGSSVSYTLSNVPAGTWWIDYWLDNDYSLGWSFGDFVGWYGSGTWGSPVLTLFTITNGEVKTINMTAYLIQ